MKSRRLIILCLTVLFLSAVTLAFATPPKDIHLEYNPDTGELTIRAAHVSQDLNKHYIRRAVVVKNTQEPQNFYFTRQTQPDQFEATVTFRVDVGDQVSVKLYCSEGGVGEASLDIQQPAPEEAKEQN